MAVQIAGPMRCARCGRRVAFYLSEGGSYLSHVIPLALHRAQPERGVIHLPAPLEWGNVTKMPPSPPQGLAREMNELADLVTDLLGGPRHHVPFSVRYGIAYAVLNAGYRKAE